MSSVLFEAIRAITPRDTIFSLGPNYSHKPGQPLPAYIRPADIHVPPRLDAGLGFAFPAGL